jgi:hypothetical protein
MSLVICQVPSLYIQNEGNKEWLGRGYGIFFWLLYFLVYWADLWGGATSNFMDMLRALVVLPIEGPPLIIFFAVPLVFH